MDIHQSFTRLGTINAGARLPVDHFLPWTSQAEIKYLLYKTQTIENSIMLCVFVGSFAEALLEAFQ